MSGAYDVLNEILRQHGDSGDKLTVRTFTNEDDDPTLDVPTQTFVLLEGSPEALRFLAETILAHLNTSACDLTMHPSGAGSAHFSATSTAGISLHTLPCTHEPHQSRN
jgi:hypothetical protein